MQRNRGRCAWFQRPHYLVGAARRCEDAGETVAVEMVRIDCKALGYAGGIVEAWIVAVLGIVVGAGGTTDDAFLKLVGLLQPSKQSMTALSIHC